MTEEKTCKHCGSTIYGQDGICRFCIVCPVCDGVGGFALEGGTDPCAKCLGKGHFVLEDVPRLLNIIGEQTFKISNLEKLLSKSRSYGEGITSFFDDLLTVCENALEIIKHSGNDEDDSEFVVQAIAKINTIKIGVNRELLKRKKS